MEDVFVATAKAVVREIDEGSLDVKNESNGVKLGYVAGETRRIPWVCELPPPAPLKAERAAESARRESIYHSPL